MQSCWTGPSDTPARAPACIRYSRKVVALAKRHQSTLLSEPTAAPPVRLKSDNCESVTSSPVRSTAGRCCTDSTCLRIRLFSLELLNTRGWTMLLPVHVSCDEPPPYERLSKTALQMRKNGVSVTAIAAQHGVTRPVVESALRFATTGERPKWPKKSKKQTTKE